MRAVIVIALFTTPLVAQRPAIVGIVRDGASHATIAGASVVLVRDAGAYEPLAMTNSASDGRFRFAAKPADTHGLRVRAIGYTSSFRLIDSIATARDTIVVNLFPTGAPDSGERASPACVLPAIDTSGWRRVGGSVFTISIPAMFRRTEAGGLDSEAGSWLDQTTSLISYDYGEYSSSLTPRDHLPLGARECDTRIDGRRAHIASWRDTAGLYNGGANWPGLVVTSFGTVSLSVFIRAPTEALRDQLMATLWTMHFKAPGSQSVPDSGVLVARPPDDTLRVGNVAVVVQVESPAIPSPLNQPPEFPPSLRRSSPEGNVLARFVVDTTGLVDLKTFKIVRSSDTLFSDAVRRAVARYRFTPATLAGRAVRQQVEMPFIFGR